MTTLSYDMAVINYFISNQSFSCRKKPRPAGTSRGEGVYVLPVDGCLVSLLVHVDEGVGIAARLAFGIKAQVL